MEVLFMLWLKGNTWKIGLVVAALLFLFILLAWVLVSAATAHEKASGLLALGTVTVQATPTADATETALAKEKLELDAEKDRSDLFWGWTSSGTVAVGLAGIVFSVFQYMRARLDKRVEQTKKDDEQFHSLLRDLENDKEGVRIDVIETLRSFLRPGYERFYRRIFDRMVRSLRERDVKDMDEPLDALSEELITTFKASFPLARSSLKRKQRSIQFNPAWLDASLVRLDKAYLSQSDLRGIGMPNASLKKADLSATLLSGSYLHGANFSQAELSEANLSRAKLMMADLTFVELERAILSKADLSNANLKGAILDGAELAESLLSGTHPELAASLKGTDLTEY